MPNYYKEFPEMYEDDSALWGSREWAEYAMRIIRKIMKDKRLDDEKRFDIICEIVRVCMY